MFIQEVERRGQNTWLAAPQLSTSVQMKVTGLITRAKVEQRFTNPSDDWVDVRYLFPLPEDAAVDHLRIYVGERIIEGEIQPKAKAREQFNQAATEGKKASLVEQHRANLFSTQLANVAPGETIRVLIEYQDTVRYENSHFSLRFPTTFTQRYIPGPPESELITQADSESASDTPLTRLHNGWAIPTETVPDATEITGEYRDPLLDDPIDFTLEVDLNAGLPIENIQSAAAEINVEALSSGRYIVTLSEANIANQDFVLTWEPQASATPSAALFVDEKEGQRFGLLMAMPPNSKNTEIIPQNITFILDVSGSMYGDSIAQAKEALRFGLQQLRPESYFNLIIFNDSAKKLSTAPIAASRENIAKVTRFIQKLEADGGTEMASAISKAFHSAPLEGYLNQIVFITDGAVGNEEALFNQIQHGLGSRRLFTVGIGSAPNAYFMKRAAIAGKGTFTFVGNTNQVTSGLKPLFEAIAKPVMRDIQVQWKDGSSVDAWPDPIADLYQNLPLQIAFKIPEGQNSLVVRGTQNAESWQQQIDLQSVTPAKASGIDVIWARKKIESLELNTQIDADDKEAQITALGLAHHLVTKHTSLIAVDKTQSRPDDAETTPALILPHAPKNNLIMLQSGLGSHLDILFGALITAISLIGFCLLKPKGDQIWRSRI
ncbi:marine proteobacterial sortase target protein [Enterovibrio paralichthyis]|uniref:marine proteobacterial sortase target protein n=1 Tax=Enterovibrio paralichthyis TaxID=2853805 RepID=UPI002103D2BF|nr:marine proteobacterial sortase target protein [Enterovibrio paralichthyis]